MMMIMMTRPEWTATPPPLSAVFLVVTVMIRPPREVRHPSSLLDNGGKLQLPVAEELFWNSFFLQNSAGDLPSAAAGFDALATARRGNSWKRGTATTAAAVETLGETRRADQMVTGGVGGGNGGDGGDRSSSDGGGGVVSPDTLEAFLEPYEGVVREFTSKAARNFDAANSEVRGTAVSHRRCKEGKRAS